MQANWEQTIHRSTHFCTQNDPNSAKIARIFACKGLPTVRMGLGCSGKGEKGVTREDLLDLLLQVYQEVWEEIPLGIHIVDFEGYTRLYNHRMAEIDGFRPAQAVHKRIFDLYPQLTEESSTLWQVLQTGRPVQTERQEYLGAGGKRIVTRNYTLPLLWQGEVLGAMEIADEFTQTALPILRHPSRHQKGGVARHTLEEIVGHSAAIAQAKGRALRAARTDATVILWGETGVGKELFAQGIHSASGRKEAAFVAENCAALPAELMEGILFGTRRGGFTGAVDRPGLFELAKGGTLLLDELQALAPDLQAKLLRVLQEREFRPIGGVHNEVVEARFIAALNIHPWQAVETGLLREDLFYRLSVIPIYVPPLRERREDIPTLAEHFLRQANDRHHLSLQGFAADVLEWLQDYPWPGNVRQLKHVIEGASALSSGRGLLYLRNVTEVMQVYQNETTQTAVVIHQNPGVPARSLAELEGGRQAGIHSAEIHHPQGQTSASVVHLEERFVQQVLRANHGNISATARQLGISRQRLQYHLRKGRNIAPDTGES
ncbi:PAS domain S-box protein [Alicyclobacillaceae bacterium I2511]|nr:PAS domain S-box protein [Alicyclobacillaceae bacterium I2511]